MADYQRSDQRNTTSWKRTGKYTAPILTVLWARNRPQYRLPRLRRSDPHLLGIKTGRSFRSKTHSNIGLVGDYSVGKLSLLKRFVDDTFLCQSATAARRWPSPTFHQYPIKRSTEMKFVIDSHSLNLDDGLDERFDLCLRRRLAPDSTKSLALKDLS